MVLGDSECKILPMAVGGILLIVTLLIIYYVWNFSNNMGVLGSPESFASGNGTCGSRDQLCLCGNNETMVTHRVTDSDLSKIASGY